MKEYDNFNPEIYYPEEPLQVARDSVAKEQTRSGSRKNAAAKKKASERRKKPESGKTATTTNNGTGIKEFATARSTRLIVGIILLGFAAYLLISFVSYLGSCFKDQALVNNSALGSLPNVQNKGGEGGARLSELLINEGFGLGSLIIVFWCGVMAMKLLIGQPRYKTLNFTIKCIIGLITISLIIGLFTIGSDSAINWGGFHGRYVNEWIIGFFGWWGAIILCLVMVSLFVAICMRDIVRWIMMKKSVLDTKRREILAKKAKEKARERELAEMKQREIEEHKISEGIKEEQPETDENNGALTFTGQEFIGETDLENLPEDKQPDLPVYDEVKEEEDVVAKKEEIKESVSAEAEAVKKEEEKGDTDLNEPMVVNVNQIEKVKAKEDYSRRSMFKFPPLSLLVQREEKISVDPDEQLRNKEKIRKTLMDFGIPIVSIEATVGPTVTLYEIKPDKGHRIANIKRLVDDISLSLAAIGVRLIAPIPGKGTVGIEVANKNPQVVSIKSVLQSKEYQETRASLPLALGATISNKVYIADLASLPHLLVAGATGQGKSVGLNVIIASLLYKKRPDELKFVLFDPKMVEFNLYEAIEKQYLAKLPDEEEAIITDMNKVVPTLSSLCVEMDNRYMLLKDAEVRKVEEYNKLVRQGVLDESKGHRYLPYIVVIVDEFSDLIMVAGKEVEMPIARLAQKARAVGIHVIIATQRPSAQVITGNIKGNFPCRMAFKVSSGVDSKVILDASGAQQLIGKGDMLVSNNSEMVRVQCAFIDTPEVKAMCEHIGSQPYPAENSPYILPEPLASGESSEGSSMVSGDRDPLYDEIRTYVITSGTASTSNLQRRYSIGYNRAGKIMDQLEADGVVGPSQGGKPRAVLVNSI